MAKEKATKKAKEAESKSKSTRPKKATSKTEKPTKTKGKSPSKSEKGASLKVDKKIIKEVEKLMKDFLKKFDVDAEVTVQASSYEDQEGVTNEFVDVKIEGEDIGVLIGYMGRNLRSLQRLVGAIVNRRLQGKEEDGASFIRVVIDVSGYREKRENSLEKMAVNIREEVLASNEPVDLPSMTSFERRVIHTVLSNYDDVTTESFGEGRGRYVRVFPIGEDSGE